MTRNIIFSVLFIIVYAGAVLFGTNRETTQKDRWGNGVFTGNSYVSERFGIGAELDSGWIRLDGPGAQTLDSEYDYANDGLTPLFGYISKKSTLQVCVYADDPYSDDIFSLTYWNRYISETRADLESIGARWNGSAAYELNAKGSGDPIVMYYMSYTYGADDYNTFFAVSNINGNGFMFSGNYNDFEGLSQVKEFLTEKFYVNSTAGENC